MDLLHRATSKIILIEFFSSSTDLAVFLIETIAVGTFPVTEFLNNTVISRLKQFKKR